MNRKQILKDLGLSDRQIEIMTCAMNGMSNAETGIKLGILENSVKFHLTKIFKKTGYDNKKDLVASINKKFNNRFTKLQENTDIVQLPIGCKVVS